MTKDKMMEMYAAVLDSGKAKVFVDDIFAKFDSDGSGEIDFKVMDSKSPNPLPTSGVHAGDEHVGGGDPGGQAALGVQDVRQGRFRWPALMDSCWFTVNMQWSLYASWANKTQNVADFLK